MEGRKAKETIISCFNKSGIKDASFCAFLPLSYFLFDCAAKKRLPKNAKTVLTCFLPYKVKDEKPFNISRYAAVPDYHEIFTQKLNNTCALLRKNFPDNTFEPFCDNSPLREVYAAAKSGLGVLGDNGLLITKEYGSFVFLGEIVTDLYIECDGEIKECLHCGNCKKGCPKDTLGECLSAVTQKKGELSPAQKKAVKENGSLWGCDICQENCPFNITAKTTYVTEFINGYKDRYEKGEDIKNRAFAWRGEKVILRNTDL